MKKSDLLLFRLDEIGRSLANSGHALALIEPETPAFRDPFNQDRRFEQRFPGLAAELAKAIRGYEGSADQQAYSAQFGITFGFIQKIAAVTLCGQ